MKVHTFIKDTKAMSDNEKEAITKRLNFIHKKQQNYETDGKVNITTEEAPIKTRKKKKKEGV